MKEVDERRRYLRDALADKGVNYNDASGLLGYGHAYIQQYVTGRSPQFLKDADVEILAKHYGLDITRLLAPRKVPKPRSIKKVINGDAEISGDLSQQDRDELILVRIWRKLDPALREATITILDALTKAKAS